MIDKSEVLKAIEKSLINYYNLLNLSQYAKKTDLTNYALKEDIPTVTNDLTNELKANYDAAYTHSQSTHAPTNAQANADITKAEIEAKLTGDITTHTHSQYAPINNPSFTGDVTVTGKVTVGTAPTENMDVATKKYVDENNQLCWLEDYEATGSKLQYADVNVSSLTSRFFYAFNFKKHPGVTTVRLLKSYDDGTIKSIINLGSTLEYMYLINISSSIMKFYLKYATGIVFQCVCTFGNTSDECTFKRTPMALYAENTYEYTPTTDYNPTTKKYVDDKFIALDSMETVGTIPQSELQKCNNGTSRYVSSIDFDTLFSEPNNYMYYATYKDDTLIPIQYQSNLNRMVTNELDSADGEKVIIGFDYGTHMMYPFNGGMASIKAYTFTNDLIIKRCPLINANIIATKKYVDDKSPEMQLTYNLAETINNTVIFDDVLTFTNANGYMATYQNFDFTTPVNEVKNIKIKIESSDRKFIIEKDIQTVVFMGEKPIRVIYVTTADDIGGIQVGLYLSGERLGSEGVVSVTNYNPNKGCIYVLNRLKDASPFDTSYNRSNTWNITLEYYDESEKYYANYYNIPTNLQNGAIKGSLQQVGNTVCYTTATTVNPVALGYKNTGAGYMLGYENTTTGNLATSIGTGNTTSNLANAFGFRNNVTGGYNIALGTYLTVPERSSLNSGSMIIGSGGTLASDSLFAISTSTQTAEGNITRKNVKYPFEVKDTNDVYLRGANVFLESDNEPTTDNHLVTKKYVDGKVENMPYTIEKNIVLQIPQSSITSTSYRAEFPIFEYDSNKRYIINYNNEEHELYQYPANLSAPNGSTIKGPTLLCELNSGKEIKIRLGSTSSGADDTKLYIEVKEIATTDLVLTEYSVKTLDNKYIPKHFESLLSISLGRKKGTAIGLYSSVLGYDSEATNYHAHAEGESTTASGESSHAEGNSTVASGENSHAEGSVAKAIGDMSHAEGFYTEASGSCSHAEGSNTKAIGMYSHAEGSETKTKGRNSHAEGYSTIASGEYQHVEGKNNIEDTTNTYVHIVGNGTSDTARSNAHTLDWDGNAWYKGKLSQDGTPTEDKDLATKKYVDEKVAGIVDSAPETLNTLNELATALGDDANFATTVTTQIGNKVDKVDGKGLSTNDLTNELKTNYDTSYTHSQSAHAPSNAQKNSDITKAEIEAKLTGNITTHTHSQYLTEHQDISGKANVSGQVFTGTVEAPVVKATSYFFTPALVNEGDLTSYYHRLNLGYANHDYWEFHEYGGDYRFYKNTAGTDAGKSLIANITSTGSNFVGQLKEGGVRVYSPNNKPTASDLGITIPEAYVLPIANQNTLGGIKVGAGLSITADGILSATGGGTADSVNWENVVGKPSFATVATSGDYNDLTNKPTIPEAGIPSLVGSNENTVKIWELEDGVYNLSGILKYRYDYYSTETGGTLEGWQIEGLYIIYNAGDDPDNEGRTIKICKNLKYNFYFKYSLLNGTIESSRYDPEYIKEDNPNPIGEEEAIIVLPDNLTGADYYNLPAGVYRVTANLSFEASTNCEFRNGITSDLLVLPDGSIINSNGSGQIINLSYSFYLILNDTGEVCAAGSSNNAWIRELATVAISGSYNDLTDKPTIPTVTNDLTNALKSNYDTAYTHSQSAHAPTNAEANVQADWNVTDTSSDAYIKNKPTIPSTDGLASTTYVDGKVAGIVNSAPETLDTLNELATALGDDPNFATTVANQIGTKVDKVDGKGLSTNDLTNTLKANYDTAYAHSQSTHAPNNAQKNSDITKSEIEAKLTGNITTHTHNQYLTEHQDLSGYAPINNPSFTGDVTVAGKVTVGTAPTENMDVATKKYVDDAVTANAGSGTGSTANYGPYSIQYNSSNNRLEFIYTPTNTTT